MTAVPWSNNREDPHWFNAPSDAWLLGDLSSSPSTSFPLKNTKLVLFPTSHTDFHSAKLDASAYLGTNLHNGRCIDITMKAWALKGPGDQGGLFLKGTHRWMKTGIECDEHSELHLMVALTRIGESSDWSVAEWPKEWNAQKGQVTIRVMRMKDSILVRMKMDDGEWKIVRLCPWPEDEECAVGPYAAAPESDGLSVEFSQYEEGTGDLG